MRVLVAGGFGFVGGRLVEQLQQVGHKVTVGSRNIKNILEFLPNATVTQINWSDDKALEKICLGVDVVIQAAGMNAHDCAANPVAALEFNGLATARLCAAASRSGVSRFIYLSTAHVYASPLAGIITEDACPRNLHPYATSHLAGENAVLSTERRDKIEGIVLRASNIFGVPVNKEVNCWMLLVNDLCRQAVETGQMILHSNGLQERDFIPMTEFCRIVERLSSYDREVGPSGIFNVGSGVTYSVLEIAKIVGQRCKLVLGFEPKCQRSASSADETCERLVYRSDRLATFGLNVNVDLNAEIDRLLEFCKLSYQ